MNPPSTTNQKGQTVTKIRTTFNPETVIDVDEAELLDLSRQGLLHSHELDAKGADAAGIKKSAKRWKDGEVEETESGQLNATLDTEKKEGE